MDMIPILVDRQKTDVTAEPDTLTADGISLSTVTVIPRNTLGNSMDPGKTVVLTTTNGRLLDAVTDNGDGSYSQLLQSPDSEGTATITAYVNGEEMNQKPVVVFVSGTGIADQIRRDIPISFSLMQNYPNPFNPNTTIEFSLPRACDVEITIYNFHGQKIATLVTQYLQAGWHKIDWNAKNIPSGVYTYTMQAGSFAESRKLIVLK